MMEKTGLPNQRVINLLYTAEEVLAEASKHLNEEPEMSEVYKEVYDVGQGVASILENLEEQMSPEDHPNYSVVPLDEPTFYLTDQAHNYRRHYEHKGRKFRVLIKRDAYNAQCYARIDGLDPQTLKWNVLAAVPYPHWPINAQSATYVVGLTTLQQAAMGELANQLTEKVRMLMFTPDEVS